MRSSSLHTPIICSWGKNAFLAVGCCGRAFVWWAWLMTFGHSTHVYSEVNRTWLCCGKRYLGWETEELVLNHKRLYLNEIVSFSHILEMFTSLEFKNVKIKLQVTLVIPTFAIRVFSYPLFYFSIMRSLSIVSADKL
jgi:hypothetical protein